MQSTLDIVRGDLLSLERDWRFATKHKQSAKAEAIRRTIRRLKRQLDKEKDAHFRASR